MEYTVLYAPGEVYSMIRSEHMAEIVINHLGLVEAFTEAAEKIDA